ncbi:AAA family ATPase [Amycolatopsis cihanbeyliensis]|uniref:ATPase family protein associated with various cellular activities (AAA) n=1 Tax=Amycolatopsis cihanbeyliensis TaxID=1128664 RepID=A0A542DLX0_AMYCI|nr:ATP-binding protein [Amycolatopsis cihanbeyliensis]TQJ04096.1 ATPase family protein associated with various cellular activities (AAA) [Amycolatopsis cihanbeyliensis]
MAQGELLRRLFASYSRADDAAFRQAADELVAEERRKNHRLLANELERELNKPRPGADLPLTLRPIPKSRDDRPLLRLTKPNRELSELVLAPMAREVIEEIVAENRSRGALTSHGLRPRQRLLLLGAPGTGKSATAHAIAAELSLPVATASLAALTSSFLGDTARNVEAIMGFAEQTPCVLLLDEFDVLGQERAQAGDHGEMRRVAATVLQSLEDLHGESLVVATSNHPQLVDAAMWRRFDELIGFDSLDEAQLAELIALKLRAMPTELDAGDWAGRLGTLSPAEVELVCFEAMRRTVLAGRSAVDDAAMEAAVERMRRRRTLIDGAAPPD